MSLNISSNLVPQVVNNYNAYTGDDKMIGLADEVTLPKIKNKTTTVNGMGIGGDVDSPVPGQFESMEATLTWNTLYSYATKMRILAALCRLPFALLCRTRTKMVVILTRACALCWAANRKSLTPAS